MKPFWKIFEIYVTNNRSNLFCLLVIAHGMSLRPCVHSYQKNLFKLNINRRNLYQLVEIQNLPQSQCYKPKPKNSLNTEGAYYVEILSMPIIYCIESTIIGIIAFQQKGKKSWKVNLCNSHVKLFFHNLSFTAEWFNMVVFVLLNSLKQLGL